ncbi:TatD family hydrolase [candidate division KSB1 bacterium]|nr:TatD family hydrolase [candidate division KSB1 bacterium]
MVLIDTHSHLYYSDYRDDLDQVLARAEAAGVHRILTIGVDLQSSHECVRLAETFPAIYAAVGIHPNDAVDMQSRDVQEIDDLLDHPRVVAIGEIGLDFHHKQTPPEKQMHLFRRFLERSQERDMPVILHTREAEQSTIACLHEISPGGWSGVFHCFGGDEETAAQAIEMGFCISFTGNITYKNSRTYQVMQSIPIDRLLLETDSPLMTPVPFRGRRNEPAFVRYVAEKIAEAKNIPIETVADQTTKNAVGLFKLADENDRAQSAPQTEPGTKFSR